MGKLLIVYDSISGNTERMAKFIAEGARKKLTDVTVKKVDEIFEKDLVEADAIAFGCPTYHRGLTSTMKSFFETRVVKVKNSLKDKVGTAFGAYGWRDDAIQLMMETLKYLNMKVLDLDQGSTGTPDEDLYIMSMSEIREKSLKFGEDLAEQIKRTHDHE